MTNANIKQKELSGAKIIKHFGDLKGKKIAVWGLAFKPGTDDVREAPAKTIISQLLERGAFVTAHDPKAQKNFAKEFGNRDHLNYVESAYEALEKADALVLVTEWTEYRRPNWDKVSARMAGKAVFDLRNQFDPEDLVTRGFHYQCIGRPDSTSPVSVAD